MKNIILITVLSAAFIANAVMAQSNHWTGSLQAGAGYWLGDATYSIGGRAWTPQTGTVQLPDKISELSFPLDVPFGSVGGNLIWKDRFEVFGTFMGNLTDPSSKVKDSDWGVFSDAGTLDIYSESDATLSAIAVDVGGRYWFRSTSPTNRFACSVGMGPSLLYQHLDWTLSNVDQWYPSRPQLAHDTLSGVAATYYSDIVMPYLDGCIIVKFNQFSGRLEAGFGPAVVQDEDNHIVRQKRSTATMAGVGVKTAAELRYDLTRHLFILARVDALSIQATGTSKERGYGGDLAGYYAEIDETYNLNSLNAGLAAGCSF